jgi:nucleotide-binding universal stress UspA family protein
MKESRRIERRPLVRPGRVVVGVTGSASSAAAVRLAATEARRSGRVLMAVLAWEPPGGEVARRLAPDPGLDRIWERAALERLDTALAAAFTGPAGVGLPEEGPTPEPEFGLRGLRVERLVVRGPAALALTWLADSSDDLLVLGAGAHRRLTRLLRGRVRRGTLARAQGPVMLVAPPAPLPALPRSVRRELHRLTPEDFLAPPNLG